jgi:hypothetical protein
VIRAKEKERDIGIGLLIGDSQIGAHAARDLAAHWFLEGDEEIRGAAMRLGVAANELADALADLRQLIKRREHGH